MLRRFAILKQIGRQSCLSSSYSTRKLPDLTKVNALSFFPFVQYDIDFGFIPFLVIKYIFLNLKFNFVFH